MLLVIASDNVFSFMLLWEIMTLLSALLILINDEEGAGKRVMIYLGIAQIGASCLMVALIIMASLAGTFEFSQFEHLDIGMGMSITLFSLLLLGLGSKAGMFPFHVWLPVAYCQCPSNASALMSGVMIKVALLRLSNFRFFYLKSFISVISCLQSERLAVSSVLSMR